MPQSRSAFLKGALRFGAVGAVAPTLIMDPRLAERVLAARAPAAGRRLLVVVQLAGGNDGLNTLVPYADSRYYQLRPSLAVPQAQALHLDAQLGLHPNLAPLKPLYDQGKLALVQGVGYPNPSLSHFRSTDIWQSAQPQGATDTGWLGRYLDADLAGDPNPLKAVSIGPLLPKAFWAKRALVPSVQSLQSFRFLAAQQVIGAFQDIAGSGSSTEGPYLSLIQMADSNAYQATIQVAKASQTTTRVQYPATALANELKLVSQIIASDLGTRLFMVTQSGFDDHADEAAAHPRLLAEFAAALAAFYQDMAAQGRADQVLLMTFSEFGRRPLENASSGTDHGTAAPLLVLGGAVKGGLYGQTPSLSDLDDGNLKFSTDFRSVYSTVLARWLGVDPTPAVLGSFPAIPFI